MKRTVLPLLAATLMALAPAAPSLAQPKGCPPGLAKKSPSCVPPGLAKKGDGEWTRDSDRDRDTENVYVWVDGRRYYVGERLPDGRVIIEDERILRRLPRLLDEDNAYVRVDGKVVEVVRATNQIVRALGAWEALLN
ncbi:excinuclease ABC subunit A [Oceanibium sediminis]|uniref:excinuclease ABC subunit A n=1 Tax=Oceanibium sediminis TaxID=2026339 RepID=UPI0013003417|nr:excinuclease ABC subunit A [Oceanibium sediminis]